MEQTGQSHRNPGQRRLCRKKHFIDSVCCVSDSRWSEAASVIDVGTGAGFPGLPLAIVSPEKEFLLIDSLNKRIRILDGIIAELGLKGMCRLFTEGRKSWRQKKYREKFDVCVSRAVSHLSVLAEYCLPFIREERRLSRIVPMRTRRSETRHLRAVCTGRICGGDFRYVYGKLRRKSWDCVYPKSKKNTGLLSEKGGYTGAQPSLIFSTVIG